MLDEYSQTHDYNEHGERISYTLPYIGTAPCWTTSVQLAYDAAGNVRDIQRTLSGSTAPKPLMSADFRSSGRPVHRDLTTDCAGAAGCIPASIVRQYGYDDTGGGQMNEVKVIARGLVVAGTHATFDGLQVRQTALLGISGGRVNEYTYDERSRLKTSAFAKPSGAAAAEEKVESFDFRTALDRPKSTPVDPPSMTFAHAPGHKIASMTRDGATRVFSYGTGAERIDDGRFAYDYDARGRMVRATEKPQGSNTTLRRITYDYSATDRIVGRTAEYAQLASSTSPPQPGDWKLEDRADVLEADALPAQITFIWDPISDQLIAIARAGATSSTDPNAGMLRQMIHGGLGYDDPIEVTAADGSATAAGAIAKASEETTAGATTASSAGLTRLYPIYDEIAGSRQAILNANGEVVSRSVMQGAYGEDPVILTGVAIDRIAIRAKKDSSGALTSVEVSIRATEPLDSTTVATGGRLAAVTPTGSVVRTATNAPKLQGSDTIVWALTATEWSTLTSSNPSVVNGTILTPALLSIAATSALRSAAWSASQPILPAPAWAITSQPIFSSSELPVESRQSLATFSPFVAAIAPSSEATSVVYHVDSLAALASTPITSPTAPRVERLLTPSSFHGLPFTDPATALVFARARWYNAHAGSFLSPDSVGYRDSSNLYAYCGGDPVNCRDPRGEAVYVVYRELDVDVARATYPISGHVYLAFDSEGLPDPQHWQVLVMRLGGQRGADPRLRRSPNPDAETFSFHPSNVRTGSGENNFVGTAVTKGSYIGYNDREADQIPFRRARTELNTNGPTPLIEMHEKGAKVFRIPALQQEQERLYIAAIAERDSINSRLNEFGSYMLGTNNCGSWAQDMVLRAGLKWPAAATLCNLGAGLGGPVARVATAVTAGLTVIGYESYVLRMLKEDWMKQNSSPQDPLVQDWVTKYNETMAKISTVPIR